MQQGQRDTLEGTGVSMPTYSPPNAVNPTVLNFNVDRSVLGPGPDWYTMYNNSSLVPGIVKLKRCGFSN